MKPQHKFWKYSILLIIFNCFLPYRLMTQCSENDQTDNCRPVRLIIWYSSNMKVTGSWEEMIKNTINAVSWTNQSIENSKYPSDDTDPQKFEIARISIIPQNPNDFTGDIYKDKQRYIYSGDVYIGIDYVSLSETDGGHCPLYPYSQCPPEPGEMYTISINYFDLKDEDKMSLTHELGHTMGCAHDLDAYQQACIRSDAPYNHGFILTYNGRSFGTPMAYFTPRVKYYSNYYAYYPDKDASDKVRLGRSENIQFCSKCIYDTKYQLRNICTTKVAVILEPETIPNGYTGEEITPWEVADAFAQQQLSTSNHGGYIVDEHAKVQFRAGKQIHIKKEFHAKSGSFFHSFISDGSSGGFYGKKSENDDEKNNLSGLSENSILGLYPNPTNYSLHIDYHLSEKSSCRIFISDLLGNKLISIDNSEKQNIGNHSIDIDLTGLSSGQYYLIMDSGKNINSKQFALIK